MRAALWGTHHEELGQVESAAVGERAALAITRGRFPKTYGYVDPNEDAVAVVAGPRATLLACADGHNGALAAQVALRALLDEMGEDPPPELSDAEWTSLFARVNTDVVARTGSGSSQPSSRTVLLAALVAGGRVSWGSMGDAALVLARPGGARGRQLNRELARYVGYPMGARALARATSRGSTSLAVDEWVVLATDGLSEFVAPLRPADVVPRALQGADSPEEGARAVVEAACLAGAGDNVAVAVLAPPCKSA